MLFGIDPLYLMIMLVAGMIVVVLLMSVIMLRMVKLLEGIKSETTNTNGHLKAVSGSLATVSTAITQPIARLGSAG